jgi:hypothetical protein
VKMIQLRGLTLLLAVGLSTSVWAARQKTAQNPPAAQSISRTLPAEIAKPSKRQDQSLVRYAWDRVGNPIGKETFFI